MVLKKYHDSSNFLLFFPRFPDHANALLTDTFNIYKFVNFILNDI